MEFVWAELARTELVRTEVMWTEGRLAGPSIDCMVGWQGRRLTVCGRSLAGGVPDTRIDQFAAVRSKDRQGGSNSKKRAAKCSKSY